MAVIGKIRQNAGLAIGIVGFSLVAFILGDLLTSNRSFLGGSDSTVGIIGGSKIKIQDFEAKVQELENSYKLNTNKETIDQNTLEQLRDQAWGQFLNDKLLGKQYEKTGISVSSEELFDMVQGKNVHPQIKEAFKDPNTGQFNASNVVQFLKNMDNDQTGRTRLQWVNFEKAIRDERESQKFNDLVKMGLYATAEEAKRDYSAKTRTASIKYILMPFASIADSTIKPSDKDLNNYYSSNKAKYKQEASRKVEYVIFDVVPSTDDHRAAEEYIAKLREPLAASASDSAFITSNADTRPDFTFHKKGTLSPVLDTVMFSSPVGTVIGPYNENNAYKIAKLMAVKDAPDSVKVSHALVAYKGSERAPANVTRSLEEAKAMADSLFKLCEKDAKKFIDIAKNVSDDAVSAGKDGDLGWITMDSPMDEEFKKGSFSISKENVKVVESKFGFHIIKVLDVTKPQKQVQVGIIDRIVEPGSKTYQSVFAKANEFAGKNNTAAAFDEACTKEGLNKRVLETLSEAEKNIPGIESPRELVRWAFRAKKDEVSKAFEFGNKFVVAKVAGIKEKGFASLEDVKQSVTEAVIKELKANQLTEKLNSYMTAGITLDQLSQKTGQMILNADGISFSSPYIKGMGMEPEVVGALFAMKAGQLSKPIKGETGVYVILAETFNEPPAAADFSANKKSLMQSLGSRSTYEVFNALKEKANVEDRRGKFY